MIFTLRRARDMLVWLCRSEEWFRDLHWCLEFISLLFFFFKHKTAYEMRISDWSSDVCSSDLLVQGAAVRDGAILISGNHGMLYRGSAAAEAYRAEIGRASCRERVCQYV